MDTNTHIHDEITRIMKERRKRNIASQQLPEVQQEEINQTNFLRTFLAFAIILMALGIIGLMINKKLFNQSPDFAQKIISQPVQSVEPDVFNPVEPTVDYMTIDDGKSLNDKINYLHHRTWLLGLAINENASVNKKNQYKYHGVVDERFIRFDKYWNMNNMPQSMTFTPEQASSIKIK